MFGMMWRMTMRGPDTPMKRAALTYSRSRIEIASDQTIRAGYIHPMTMRTTVRTFQSPPEPATRSATRRKLGMMSMKWMKARMALSARPPRKAAIDPMKADMAVVAIETVRAMVSDRPRPWTTWANMSLPAPEVPNQCSGEGGVWMLYRSRSS